MDGRATERADVVRFLRETEARYERNSKDPVHDAAVRERCRSKTSVLRTVAVYIERGDHVVPSERTPEVVLRAMLAAYEEAAISQARAYYAWPGVDPDLLRVSEKTDAAVTIIRNALAMFLVLGYTLLGNYDASLARDYEARLCGERPLDAPPIEEVL